MEDSSRKRIGYILTTRRKFKIANIYQEKRKCRYCEITYFRNWILEGCIVAREMELRSFLETKVDVVNVG